MVPVASLLVSAALFWGGAAPFGVDEACPGGVRYNVRPLAQMELRALESKRFSLLAEARLRSCVITFRAGWRRGISDREAWMVAAHEIGHAVYGLGHAERGIMAEDVLTVRPPARAMRFSDRIRAHP